MCSFFFWGGEAVLYSEGRYFKSLPRVKKNLTNVLDGDARTVSEFQIPHWHLIYNVRGSWPYNKVRVFHRNFIHAILKKKTFPTSESDSDHDVRQ